MEVGGWNKTRNHHHTFGLSFLPLDLFLCHILLTGHLDGLMMVAPQPPTISGAGGWGGSAASFLGLRAPRSGVGMGEGVG